MTLWVALEDQFEKEAKTPEELQPARQLKSRIYFISVTSKDPSDEFLKPFQNFPTRKRKASDSGIVEEFPVFPTWPPVDPSFVCEDKKTR
jgi:hypothetical protein